MLPEIPRRSFLRGALATGALVAATRANAFALVNPQRRLAPVKVSRDRIIREVVGLRPYRAEGFVVAAERLGDKLVVHNYGHGGAGITLSWGTASLAVDLLSVPPSVASGPSRQRARSSSTALRRSRRRRQRSFNCAHAPARYGNAGATVTIYAKALPPDTHFKHRGGLLGADGPVRSVGCHGNF